MDYCGDFIELLGPDISTKILMNLVSPSDLIRVSLVSSSWHQFVIENGLGKQLCLKLFPEISGIVHTIEMNNLIDTVGHKQDDCDELECLRKNHRIYTLLARAFNPFVRKDCISDAIIASSTDNYPEESINNTLEPFDRIDTRASYWSSEGQNNPAVSETLLYKLMTKMCIVTEIHVQPFQAYFQYGFPIYSSKAVRFRMGHKLQSEMTDSLTSSNKWADDEFIWTYTSPEFPMVQENCLQKFKLPEPVLCIGGYMQVELLGRVQRQEMDGRCALKYLPETGKCTLSSRPLTRENGASSRFRTFTARLLQRGTRGWEQMLLNTLLQARAGRANDADDEPPPASP
ncbi:hypothetical protein [Gossypium barbadense]|uniref:F-box domain-containing protein n=1 Tax=Gossypium barbadense TaxID=3634 RepID=A0A5J5NF02_GOSBA|nr:hypothetical protein [Gossypium barbadense]KAB1671446.1 hypothetical protein [Gossypium barbadense]